MARWYKGKRRYRRFEPRSNYYWDARSRRYRLRPRQQTRFYRTSQRKRFYKNYRRGTVATRRIGRIRTPRRRR